MTALYKHECSAVTDQEAQKCKAGNANCTDAASNSLAAIWENHCFNFESRQIAKKILLGNRHCGGVSLFNRFSKAITDQDAQGCLCDDRWRLSIKLHPFSVSTSPSDLTITVLGG